MGKQNHQVVSIQESNLSNQVTMEELINQIIEFIKKNTEDFTYMDQQLIYDDLAGK